MTSIGRMMVGVALAILMVSPVAAADTAQASAPVKGPRVTVMAVARGTVIDTVPLTGTLVARDEVLVGAEIDGLRVVELLAEEGDRVSKGQVLARLSRETIDVLIAQNDASLARTEAAILQTKSQIVQAEAQLQQARQALERTTQLRKTGFASQAVFDQQTNDEAASAARLTAARDGLGLVEADRAAIQAQRRELMIRLARTDVKAPAAGIVYRRSARVGGLAALSGEAMFRLIADGDIELEADVPERQIARIAPGMTAAVTVGDASAPGKVRLVSPEIDRTTRLGRVRIQIGEAPGFRIGAFARGSVEVRRASGLAVPLSAVLYGDKGPFVQVVRNDAIVSVPIRTGVVDGRSVEVVDGLAGGERIVVKAGAFLRDGDAVTPVEQGSR